jgi:hypothetical protein
MLSRDAVESQRKNPLAYASLLLATLSPMVTGITALGMGSKRLFPSPDLLHIVAGACIFILMIPVMMCVGAWCWLLLARGFVRRPVAEAFFVSPGFGILSRVSEWMFVRVYGDEEEDLRP